MVDCPDNKMETAKAQRQKEDGEVQKETQPRDGEQIHLGSCRGFFPKIVFSPAFEFYQISLILIITAPFGLSSFRGILIS